MADYSSDGLWDSDGAGFSSDELPVSAELRSRLAAWCEWYEQSEFYLPEPRAPFDVSGFAREGLAIAKAIKTELPDWTVVYFDEAKIDRGAGTQPRSVFEYEV